MHIIYPHTLIPKPTHNVPDRNSRRRVSQHKQHIVILHATIQPVQIAHSLHHLIEASRVLQLRVHVIHREREGGWDDVQHR